MYNIYESDLCAPMNETISEVKAYSLGNAGDSCRGLLLGKGGRVSTVLVRSSVLGMCGYISDVCFGKLIFVNIFI